MKTKKDVGNMAAYLLLIIGAAAAIFPFYWMVKTALITDAKAMEVPPKLLPWPVTFENFVNIFEMAPMGQGLLNSLLVAVLGTAGSLFTCSLAAFAFAKLHFRFSKQLFGGIFTTMLVPSQVTLIPLYVIFSRIGWTDSFIPLILPRVMIFGYGVFMLRQFMSGIPDSYIEAAKLDGAGYLRIWGTIMVPLCKSAFITLGMFTFVINWNQFLEPLIFLDSEARFTLPLIVNSFRTTYYVNWGLLMAASSVAVIPLLVSYLFVQRTFVEGIAMTGVKG